ncbi:MAG TPA: YCF48-related protein [Pyrinomonadaceae bacterium]|nr:YCF48-related protein [Pyrinomonadaceae bacterium]
MNQTRVHTGRMFFATLILLFIAVTSLAQQGWVATKIATANKDLNTVYFLDEKRGWVGGDDGFLSRTDDGGHTWVQQIVDTKDAINDIYFRDKEDGFLIAGNAVFITKDKGNRWTEVRRFQPSEFEGADVELYSVRFPNKKKGWIVGSVSKRGSITDSILLYTENSGETWQRRRAPSRLELIHIEFVNEKRGWIVGAAGTILATVDEGETWTKQDAGVTSTIYHVDFRNDRKGIAVGERGTILRTTDGGASWSAVVPKTRSTLLNVDFVSDDNGWAVGRGGTILRTEDAGSTWIEQETGTKLNLYGLHFAKKIGWAVGADGVLLRYEQ